MSAFGWILMVAVGVLGAYVLFVASLVAAGRRTDARALAGFIPDSVVLMRRLLGDDRVPRRRKAVLMALVGYLSLPLDLVPDFIPVLGQLDDALLVAAALAYVARRAGGDVIRELWPGDEAGLRVVLALAR
jgi:uncharacterized membrane protein YkvA (DUF1232 family)